MKGKATRNKCNLIGFISFPVSYRPVGHSTALSTRCAELLLSRLTGEERKHHQDPQINDRAMLLSSIIRWGPRLPLTLLNRQNLSGKNVAAKAQLFVDRSPHKLLQLSSPNTYTIGLRLVGWGGEFLWLGLDPFSILRTSTIMNSHAPNGLLRVCSPVLVVIFGSLALGNAEVQVQCQ